MRTAYLKTLDTVVSDDVDLENEVKDKKTSCSERAVKDTKRRKKEKAEQDSRKSKKDVKKMRNDGQWIDEYTSSNKDVGRASRKSVMKKAKDIDDTLDEEKRHRLPSQSKLRSENKKKRECNGNTDRAPGIGSRRKGVSKEKRNEILEKYRSRIHVKGKRDSHGEVSRESDMDTEVNADLWPSEKSKSIKGDVLGSKSFKMRKTYRSSDLDDSESEINFIVDLYDKTSFNNNLREKMLEYLSRMEKK